MDATTTAPAPADELVDLATLSTETIMGLAAGSARRMSCEAGLFVQYAGELGQREGWRLPKERRPWRPG